MAQPMQTVKRGKRRELSQDPRKLRRRRIAAGLTGRALRDLSGVSTGTISMLESGFQSASPTTLGKLAAALGCEIADLMPDAPSRSAA